MKMLAKVIALATVASGTVLAVPAAAQTASGEGSAYNTGTTFGNSGGIVTGFVNTFTFNVTQAGTLTVDLSNSGVNGSNTDIDFSLGNTRLTGPGISTTFTRVSNDPAPELLFSGPLAVTPGLFTLVVRGNALGTAASYSGNFLVATSGGAVPEPAAWAMMIGGMGVAGGAIRRRRRDQAKASFA